MALFSLRAAQSINLKIVVLLLLLVVVLVVVVVSVVKTCDTLQKRFKTRNK